MSRHHILGLCSRQVTDLRRLSRYLGARPAFRSATACSPTPRTLAGWLRLLPATGTRAHAAVSTLGIGGGPGPTEVGSSQQTHSQHRRESVVIRNLQDRRDRAAARRPPSAVWPAPARSWWPGYRAWGASRPPSVAGHAAIRSCRSTDSRTRRWSRRPPEAISTVGFRGA